MGRSKFLSMQVAEILKEFVDYRINMTKIRSDNWKRKYKLTRKI